MFHLINQAWIDILARQLRDGKIQSVLCVYSQNDNLSLILEAQAKYMVKIDFIPIDYFSYLLKMCKKYNIEPNESKIIYCKNYDDILVSQDLHDIFVKDFLAKHCKRIHRNLK